MARETETPSTTPDPSEDATPQDDGTPSESPATGAQEQKAGDDGFALLREHHKTLRALLGEAAEVSDAATAEDVLPKLATAWADHARAHGWLYDAGIEAGLQEFPLLTDLAVETDLVSFLLGRAGQDLDEALQPAALRVSTRMIREIIEREEKPRSGLLAKAKAAGVEPAALGRRIGARTKTPSRADGETRPQLRHLTANQEDIMPRNSNMPERDDRGRFVSDDDYGGRGGSGGRGRDDDDRDRDSRGRFTSDRDDDRYSSRGRSSRRDDDDRDRDSRGRFTSDRDDDRYSSRGRSSRDDDRDRDSRGRFTSDRDDDRRYAASRRDDDDRRSYSRGRDDDYSRDRGQGGWFGDSEGHAEAARRGWDHRRDDDDDRSSSRGRSSRDDDDRDRDSRGRFTSDRDDDRRSYSRGRDDDYSRDRGQGGWFGYSRGHAEAARRGWDNRRDDDDDDRRSSSRGRR